MYFIFQSNTVQHKPLVQSEVFELRRRRTRVIFYNDEWAIILLAKDLLHHFQTIIFHNIDLMIRIR